MSQQEDAGKRDIWSAGTYTGKVAPFVAQLTTKVVAWLDPQPADDILDVGCGDGVLTAKLASHVHSIVGIDASRNMISAFHTNYPSIPSRVVDCRHMDQAPDLLNGSFSKVFSNAALHWILRDPSTRKNTIEGCYKALKPGGLFVAESGGLGNVCEVHSALIGALVHRGIPAQAARDASPWWFPSLQAMRNLLEGAGFEWINGEIELRQTVLTTEKGGGLAGWVSLFGADFLALLKNDAERESAVNEVCEVLEGVGRREEDGAFILNYIRLRFIAKKPDTAT